MTGSGIRSPTRSLRTFDGRPNFASDPTIVQRVAADRVAPVRVVAFEDARVYLRDHGGHAYLWTDVHGVYEGKVTLPQVATDRLSDESLRFERIGSGDLDVFLASGSRRRLESVDLELHGRKKQIRAAWNGQASAG